MRTMEDLQYDIDRLRRERDTWRDLAEKRGAGLIAYVVVRKDDDIRHGVICDDKPTETSLLGRLVKLDERIVKRVRIFEEKEMP